MSYGLYDADLQFYPIPFYNLELMKLSSYYKRKREIVSLSPVFAPNKYSHFIVRQDFDSGITYPSQLDQIVYGGRAFDGHIYKPMPYEIEIMKPDISLYNTVKSRYSKKYKSSLSTMARAEHARLSLDGKTIWKDFEKQIRHDNNSYGLILHDYDLNKIMDASYFLQNELPNLIKNLSGRRIGMKYPMQIDNEQELLKWLIFEPLNIYFSLQFNGLPSNTSMPYIAEVKKHSYAWRQVLINITPNLNIIYSDAYIRRVFRYIVNLRSYGLFFPLIYDENAFSEEWRTVIKFLDYYNNHLCYYLKSPDFCKRVEPYETLFSYAKSVILKEEVRDKFLSKESIQQIFQFVRENNYELFKDFYEYRGEEVRK